MESPIEALLSLSFKDFCFLLGMDLLLWFVLSILLEIVKRLEKRSDSLIWPVLELGLAFLLNLALVVGFPGTLLIALVNHLRRQRMYGNDPESYSDGYSRGYFDHQDGKPYRPEMPNKDKWCP